MRVYRTIVNKEDVIHYIIKDGEFFFSEADLAAKHRIYGRSDTDNVEIPVGAVMRFISLERVKEKYPDVLSLTRHCDSETILVATQARAHHGRQVISFSVDDAIVEIID